MKLPLAAVLAVSLVSSAHAADVVVTISGIEPGKGQVKVGVCNTELSRKGCPLTGEANALAESQTFIFEGLPEGSYGFNGYQDMNSNQDFDRNMIGIPQEPYALSGIAAEKTIPTFKDTLTPVFDGADNQVGIRLQRFGDNKKKKPERSASIGQRD